MWKGSRHPATKKARMAGTAINHPIERGSPLQLGASSPVRSASTHCGRSRRSGLQAVIALVCLLAGTLAWAGVADNSSRYGYGVRSEGSESPSNGYYAALRESSVARQIASLERFLSFGANGPLARSALELLAWDYLQVDAPARAVRPANMLLAIDSENALALAVLVDPRVGSTGDAQDRFRLAGEGVAGFRRLLKPAGMRNEEFIRLQRHVLSTLEGEAGLGYLEQKDYPTAQQYLRQAVTGAPNNGRYVYGLALAMLGQNPPQNEGYWYLARAVNLSRRTPQGAAIAEFARRQYVGAGGSEDNWERFLAVTTASTFATTNAGRASAPRTLNRQTEQSSLGVTRSQPGASQTIPRPPDAHAGPSGTVQTASLTAPTTGSKTEAAPSTGLQLPPIRKHVFIPRDSPLSLGILIQKSRLTAEDRSAIVFALSDLVRHLRQDDEVFVMGFSNELEFEQDLTRNNKLLEEAIANIKPQSGAALLDAVAFAAGHLDRIAKNRSRVLLVISDGHDAAAHVSEAEINGVLGRVRVDCIGIDVDDTAGMNLLQSLAAESGGQSSFASGPREFRTATWEFAKSMGIEFPY